MFTSPCSLAKVIDTYKHVNIFISFKNKTIAVGPSLLEFN